MSKLKLLITHDDEIDDDTAYRHIQIRLDGWSHGVKIERVLEEEPDVETLSLRRSWDQCAGRVSAFKEVVDILSKRAGELFTNEKDDQAKLVRDLVKQFEPKLKEEQRELDLYIRRSRESRGT